MALPDSRPEVDEIDESDDSAESDSSGSEEEEDGNDSGMDEKDESDSESESGIAGDFCIHQKVCPSVADCVIYEKKLVEEKRRLRVRLKELRAGCKALTEKRRALSVIKQTIHVESKIGELELVLGWMYEAREKMSTGSAAEIKHAQEYGRQATEQLELLEATGSHMNEG